MKKKRAMNLLNDVIEYVMIGNRNQDVIKWCLYIGFSAGELISDFNFDKKDVEETIKELASDPDGYKGGTLIL